MQKVRSGLAVLGVVAAAAFALDRPFFGVVAAPTSSRPYTEGRYALELDNQNAGWIHSAEGGGATSDVVSEKIGPDFIQHKHIAGLKYEDITLEFGTGMSKGLLGWIRDSFGKSYVRKTGAVVAGNFDNKEVSRLNFFNAILTEVRFPELEAGSKEPAFMSLKFTPEYTRTVTGGGKPIPASGPVNTNKQKQWQPSNFRLTIDGLDCTHVSKIEPLKMSMKTVDSTAGELRDYLKAPGHPEYSNIVLYVAETHAKSFYDWHESFVIKSQSSDDKEKNGKLEFLAANLQEVLFTLDFKHLGIFKMTPEKVEAGIENVRRVKVEMYVEQMIFSYNSSWQ